MEGVTAWNTGAGNFRDFLYEGMPNLELVDRTRWLSVQNRVSNYCIEGERGFIHWNNTDMPTYKIAVQNLFKK